MGGFWEYIPTNLFRSPEKFSEDRGREPREREREREKIEKKRMRSKRKEKCTKRNERKHTMSAVVW